MVVDVVGVNDIEQLLSSKQQHLRVFIRKVFSTSLTSLTICQSYRSTRSHSSWYVAWPKMNSLIRGDSSDELGGSGPLSSTYIVSPVPT